MNPNLFLVGAPKCGTTALYEYLGTHPEVFCSPLVKEFNHFNQDLTAGRSGVVSRADYLGYFKDAGSQRYAVDGSVWYLFSEAAAREIHGFCPSAKIIIALRDPVDQVASLHSQRLSTGNENISDLTAALAAETERRAGLRIPVGAHVPRGLLYREVASYCAQVQRFLELFPADNVHIMFYEDFRDDPEREYRKILNFLGLPPVMPGDFAIVNPNKAPRSLGLVRLAKRMARIGWLRAGVRAALPAERLRIGLGRWINRMNSRKGPRAPLPKDVQTGLRADFAADIARLETLLGRKLPWPSRPGAPRGSAA